MKLLVAHRRRLKCIDLQVAKAVVSLARKCPSRSMVSGMASITLVNYPFSGVANIPLRRMRISCSLRLQDLNGGHALSISSQEQAMSKRKQKSKLQSFNVQSLPKQLQHINLNAAGIDIGSERHMVAVPEGRDPVSVREFGPLTSRLLPPG